ncbi:ABC transporter permease [Brenneria goodwinii]|uniref:ABC transporter permease n=1 Tax=Brenneria goodwinii TaxID=1109412 RepID=UPI000EF1FE40|nr:ABC transporter permease [Brenneria goodwinii]MCG8158347.1 ABC transporter permease [Brenneria goodwinii]MCG8161159.1 ABC transporter permease [Brenneria goodwinii]MCG8165423.1 ABC transporter permease [Brenneria goodwinii]MCG8169906.1 ABC transporter permease [Brenneria goodwinii]MCG8177122.1 ABC transporter permease [Brenneria goodwinii]
MSSETSAIPAASTGGISAQLRAGLLTWPVMLGAVVLLIVVALAVLAPWISSYSPIDIDPSQRLKPPSALHWLGTDALGRDIFARVVHGGRQSLVVGLGAVCISVIIGLVIGVFAGYFRLVDAIVMRIMDGLMAIPGILLAIALVSLSGASLFTVLVAISIPEIPRVVRMVRSVIMGVRNESYVEAAIILGTPVPVIMWRHMLPSTVAPLIVQGTYIFASAILTEAILSFLGAGIPPEIPSWGNIMADGRVYFMMLPGMILYPGILVSLTVLSVNVLGDAVRDALDPRMAKRL